MNSVGLGKLLLIGAGILAATGGLLVLLGSSKLPFGRLPGDISFRRGNLNIFVPLATSLLFSVVLTLLLNLFLRRR